MKPILKKIRVLSFARFQAVLMALVGLVAGVIYSFGGLALDVLVSANLLESTETTGLGYGTLLAFGALLGMPAIFGVAGYILGVIEALVFNVASKYLGGIKTDFER